ncbi:cell wall hydrolase [Sphingomonas baiyangensis]|uniref:Cell wall hydrolase n=1 Tax=Sphingomonas baiyangensis TaxID=2572576 RepID=A0A4U1L6K0_9SPHN|nr:cell wall hydrolase [Sphingomonas baiyangensis]TKD51915.1 cell wall hydrolase [Sphingomonas baiyangensis]
MKFATRAASIAALTICAAGTLGATTPGFAIELDPTSLTATDIKRSYPQRVPIPPAPIVPAAWTAEDGETPPTLADNGTTDSQDSFASLSDAVAAQSSHAGEDRELACLATGIFFESKGEPLAGQLAVAEVILNRARSGRYPSTVCGVLTQPKQFSFVRRGRLPAVSTGHSAWRTAVAVARVARAGLWESKVSNALHFHARYVSPGWNRTRIAALGNHIFYE